MKLFATTTALMMTLAGIGQAAVQADAPLGVAFVPTFGLVGTMPDATPAQTDADAILLAQAAPLLTRGLKADDDRDDDQDDEREDDQDDEREDDRGEDGGEGGGEGDGSDD